MATAVASTPIIVRQFVANGAITQYRMVKLSTASTDEQVRVTAPAATTDQCIGVALESASDGGTVRVGILGIFPVEAHAAITANTLVTLGATTGRISTQTAGSGVNQPLSGLALEAATAQGDYIAVMIMPSLIMQGQ